MRAVRISIAVALALTVLAPPLGAQSLLERKEFTTEGFFFGAHLSSSSLQETRVGRAQLGHGFGAGIGYGIGTRFALVTGFDYARIPVAEGDEDAVFWGDYGYAQVDALLRYHISRWHGLVPYLDVGITEVAAVFGDRPGEATISGRGAVVGAGAQYFVSGPLAIHASLRYTVGEFRHLRYDRWVEGVDGGAMRSARAALGALWHP
jgi:hypothetical protein